MDQENHLILNMRRLRITSSLPNKSDHERAMLEAIGRRDFAEVKRLVELHGLYSTPNASKGYFLLTRALQVGERRIAKFLLYSGATAYAHSTEAMYDSSPLHLACSRGYRDIVELCLRRGAKVHLMDQRGRTPLYYSRDAATAMLLLKNVAISDIGTYHQLFRDLISPISRESDYEAALGLLRFIDDHDGWNQMRDQSEACGQLLMAASSAKVLRELLKRGLRAKAEWEHRVIHHCAGNWDVDKLRLLKEFGADVNVLDHKGSSALHAAAERLPHRKGHNPSEVIEFLLHPDRGLDVNLKDNYGRTALHCAIERGHVNVVKSLLVHGADPNIQGPLGITSLAMACGRGRDLAKTLLEHGADVLALMPDGDCILNKLDRMDSQCPSAIINHLLEHGLLTKLVDSNGNSALHIICKLLTENRSIISFSVVKKLLDNGLDPNLHNYRGETSLHIAAASRQPKLVRMLLDHGADVRARTTDGLTPLHNAAKQGPSYEELESEMVELLVQHGSDVNAVDVDGQTPLHYAVTKRAGCSIGLLLKFGADISIEDNKGVSPWYSAIESDVEDIIRQFLKFRDTSLTTRFHDGTTPIHLAARGGGGSLQLLCRHQQVFDIDCLDANGETPLFNALLYSSYDSSSVKFLLELGSTLDHIFWINKRRCHDSPPSVRRSSHRIWTPKDEGRQLAIKLSVARLLPDSVAQIRSRDKASVAEYKGELERLKGCMISRSMSLYDFLHDKEQLTAEAICRVKRNVEDKMADFPHYRGLIESKIKIDLARAEALQVATRRLCLLTGRSPLLRHLIVPKEILTKILLHFTHRELNLLSGELCNAFK